MRWGEVAWRLSRVLVTLWAIPVLMSGVIGVLDPGAFDSEPQPHGLEDRLYEALFVLVSILWILSPRFTIRHGLERAALVLLILVPSILVAISVFQAREDLALFGVEYIRRAPWPLRHRPLWFVVLFGLPSAATIVQTVIAIRERPDSTQL